MGPSGGRAEFGHPSAWIDANRCDDPTSPFTGPIASYHFARMRSWIFAAAFLILTASCAATAPATIATPSTAPPPTATADPVLARADLARTGKLRVAVNYGNTANATLDAAT